VIVDPGPPIQIRGAYRRRAWAESWLKEMRRWKEPRSELLEVHQTTLTLRGREQQ
jgi:hypothetical protein